MLRKLSLALTTLLSFGAALSAGAVTLEITITGTISGGSDADGSVFGLGPNGDPAGRPITIVFRLDTAKAPADGASSPTLGDYRVERGLGFPLATPEPRVDFVAATWTINGISRTSFLPNRDQVDHIFLSDGAQPGGVDSISLRDGSWDGTPSANDRLFYVTIGGIVSDIDMLEGDALQQPQGSLTALANAQSCGQCAGFWEDHTGGRNESASWFMTSTGLAISYRVVPEPVLSLLLVGGAAALIGARKRRN